MSKKWIIITLVSVILVASGLGAILYLDSREPKEDDKKARQLAPNVVRTTEDLTYDDASGFSFKYPRDVQVKDVTPDDNVFYTMLTLKKEGSELTISIKDSNYQTVDSWLGKEGGDATLSGAVSLGGISGKQFIKDGNLLTVAVDKGVLYLVEGKKDGG